ncbi:hypothetical protein CLOACE_04040 [Clostridium acetireducens DSM 10703]|jgi:hypothetical protein|uniref:SpoOB alpha-helical domain-containing protein n=1 Tax=Clostridium acetireducens DSM 10703 TaxID=1121290 RepID=A0A1E8F163_9CLOT|nr:Spo0B domain-containing protein [Clostridium acetireducens]OFI07213.1 hypothetical protein CLOACE_04040 [Clostridium acetireducens DSM 10703]
MNNLGDFINLIRKQRHDFMNDIQIIYGYIQTNKIDKACTYINKISEINEAISEIYNLGDNNFALCIESNIRKLIRNDVKFDIDIEIEFFNFNIFEKSYDKKCTLVNNIFNELENNGTECVYIYIFHDDLGQSLLISDDEGMLDEINWMENWNKEKIDIVDLELYTCYYDNSKAYRINFIKN